MTNLQTVLINYRKDNNISQDDLASLLCCSRSAVANWETGRSTPKADIYKDIAQKLNIDIKYLLDATDTFTKFPNRLRQLRKGKGLTLTEMSEKININKSSIARYESGEVEIKSDVLKQFCSFFNVSADYLLNLDIKQSPKHLSNRLKELRLEKNLTLRELADLLNISYSNIAMIERGERNLTANNLNIFCDFFGVSSDYLLGLSDVKNNNSKNLSEFVGVFESIEEYLTSDDKKLLINLANNMVIKNKK